MTGRVVWGLLLGLVLLWEAITLASRGRLPTIADLLRTVSGYGPTRWFLLMLWALLGWHVFIGFP